MKHLEPFRIMGAAGTPVYLPVVTYSYVIGMGKYELATKEDSINKKLMLKREDIRKPRQGVCRHGRSGLRIWWVEV